MIRTPSTLFRVLAIAEVFSWSLLILGLVLRATAGWDLAVTIGGGIHGFVFLSYGATAILVALNNRWRFGPAALAVMSAVVPYATVPAEIWLRRRGLLGGQWRRESTGDDRWYDPLMRWFLHRPWVLAVLIAVAVIALYAVLLTLGPPGGDR
ncbi:DUF3817 domain-containing protein [Microbacterium sp.]|uniref:DUF3817 domain-containing protein n=1 Tax=Microbacterium sp. TaxID=51671 RepID=UPI003A87CEAD